jgi:cystathionine gamma-synthase
MIFKQIDIYCVRLYGVFFQLPNLAAIDYAHVTGVSISQSLAECLHPHVEDSLSLDLSMEHGIVQSKPTYLLQVPPSLAIKERIVSLLKRVPASAAPATLISPKRPRTGDRIIPGIGVSDVYLFPTAKAALYRLHNYLTIFNDHEYISVAFGRVSKSLLDILAINGARHDHFANGDENDLANLEALCKAEKTAEHGVQALYVEFTSVSAFEGLRKLANTYGFVLIVSETTANFANVDFMSIADVLITNLAAGFSGDTDVQGGSLVLNPESSAVYRYLKPLMERNWHNEVFTGDIVELEYNSRDYLRRSATSNQNAEAIATFFQGKATKSIVIRVNYPKFTPSFELYMRDTTSKFVPGYGCLVVVDFEEQDRAVAFYAALKRLIEAHSNDCPTTLVLEEEERFLKGDPDHSPRTRRDCSVHVVAGLESTDSLIKSVKQALEVADGSTGRT